MFFNKAVLISFLLLTASCVSVPMTTPEADQEAKTFQAPKDKSRIYIFRDENFGSAIKVPVLVDAALVGQSAPKSFFVIDVEPGQHQVRCLAEKDSSLSIKTKKGAPSYIWQEMKMGMWTARCELHEVAEIDAQKRIRECKRAKSLN